MSVRFTYIEIIWYQEHTVGLLYDYYIF